MKKCLPVIAAIVIAASLISGCGSGKEAVSSAPAQETKAEAADNSMETNVKVDNSLKASESETVAETAQAVKDYTKLVTDALDEEFSGSINGYSFESHYVIPEINMGGAEIEQLNKDIYAKYYAYYNTSAKDPQQGWFDCNEVSYTWAVVDDRLSLTIWAYLYPDASGWREPDVYTVDLKTAHVMDKTDLLQYFNMSLSDYNTLCRDAMGCTYLNKYGSVIKTQSDLTGNSLNYQQYTRTVADENVDKCSFYMNEDGHPAVKALIYSIAAGDKYPGLIDLETYEHNDVYEQVKDSGAASSSSGDSVTAASKDSSASASENSAGSSSDYILPGSDCYYLTESDIRGMSSWDIQMAINEIYARHGRKFQMEEVRTYFEGKSWYYGTIDPNSFSEDVFNAFERANVDFLAKYK